MTNGTPQTLPPQTSHKAIATAIGTVVIYGIGRWTGAVEMPPWDDFIAAAQEIAVATVSAAALGFTAWRVPNQPK